MKEEQNASSSANYDVEIYHSSTAHSSILKMHNDSSAVKTIKDGLEYETVRVIIIPKTDFQYINHLIIIGNIKMVHT